MWLHLRGMGMDVVRCTVERLMRALGLHGARRGKAKRTTVADPAASRAKDLVRRNFRPLTPNLQWVADFTYVSTQVVIDDQLGHQRQLLLGQPAPQLVLAVQAMAGERGADPAC